MPVDIKRSSTTVYRPIMGISEHAVKRKHGFGNGEETSRVAPE
jgi:hypothetical protein